MFSCELQRIDDSEDLAEVATGRRRVGHACRLTAVRGSGNIPNERALRRWSRRLQRPGGAAEGPLLALSHFVIVVGMFPVQRTEFACDLPDLSLKPSQVIVASLVISLALCKP